MFYQLPLYFSNWLQRYIPCKTVAHYENFYLKSSRILSIFCHASFLLTVLSTIRRNLIQTRNSQFSKSVFLASAHLNFLFVHFAKWKKTSFSKIHTQEYIFEFFFTRLLSFSMDCPNAKELYQSALQDTEAVKFHEFIPGFPLVRLTIYLIIRDRGSILYSWKMDCKEKSFVEKICSMWKIFTNNNFRFGSFNEFHFFILDLVNVSLDYNWRIYTTCWRTRQGWR